MKILEILLNLVILLIFLGVTGLNIYIFYYIDKKQGKQGNQGEKGEKGEQGERGLVGDRGIQGYQGAKGIIGKDIGVKGLKGPPGIKGIKGDKGIMGDKGLRGDTGEDGIVGIFGEKGEKGKKGFEGLIGKNRIIKESDLRIIADKRNCIRLKDDGKFLKCPKNMAVFDIITNKIDNTPDSKLDSITCCKIDMSIPEYDLLFVKFDVPFLSFEIKNIRDQLELYYKVKSEDSEDMEYDNIYFNQFDKYDKDGLDKLTRNMSLIEELGKNSFGRKSPRDIELSNLITVLGDENLAKEIKIYTSEQEDDILKTFDSITSYELYILFKITGFKKTIIRKKSSSNTVDISRIIKEFHDFPFNDIEKLEKDNIIDESQFEEKQEEEEEEEFYDSETSNQNTESSLSE